MRKIASLLSMLMLLSALAFGQKTTVTGKVVGEDGNPLVGATVAAKGTDVVVTTNSSGVFSINVPNNAKNLVISYVGLGTNEISIKGVTGALQITLKAAAGELTEVVVTALGIRREKKALGYSVTTLGKGEIELRPESDIARILTGKAPGLDVINTSGLSGSGTNINIRGISTITGNSVPLFVVDGVPFDASTNSQSDFTYGTQTSSRFLDLDPNNIESVSVLKGLSATTLYGEQGRNGVILITTKTGSTQKVRKKAEITVSQSYFATQAVLPDYNTVYGGGFDLSVGIAYFSNWGDKFTNPPTLVPHPYDRTSLHAAFPQFIGAKYVDKFYNSVHDFFRTGSTNNTNINVAGTAGALNYNLNYGYTDDEGYIPGNNMIKNNFGMGGTAKLSNKFTVTGSFNYVTTNVKSPPTSDGYGNAPSETSVFGNVMYTPTAVDLIHLPWENPIDHSSVYYRSGNDIENPNWIIHNAFTVDQVNRFFGQLGIKYDIAKGLDLSYRFGIDNYTEFQEYAQNAGGIAGENPTGILRTSVGFNSAYNHTLILNYFKNLPSGISINAQAGANSFAVNYSQTGSTSTQQLVYGLLNHANFITQSVNSENGTGLNYISQTLAQGIFAQAQVGYKDFVYVTVGGRNDWTSTVEQKNRSIFYPSVTGAFIPTSAFESLKTSKTLNYLKIRLGYSTSADFPSPYSTRPYLNIQTRSFIGNTGTVVNTNSNSTLLPNPDLKPELLNEVETGVEARMFKNRLNLDLTLYDRHANDQILYRSIDPSSGFSSEQVNGGSVENKGIELSLGYDIIKNRDWKWNVTALYALNRSMVTKIPNDIKYINTAGYSNFGTVAENGEPLGVILGSYFVRDPKTGEKIVQPTTGDYTISNDVGIIGDPNPKYKMTGLTSLSYKAFSFNMQWEYTCGGDMFSSTANGLLGRGVTKDTEFDRRIPYILPGVDPNGNPNKVQISAAQAFFDNSVTNAGSIAPYQTAIYDATCIRLREVSLSYNLPTRLLGKSPFGSASITLSGNNLWYYAPNFPKYVHFDPDASGLGVGNGRGMEFMSGPSTRRYGASLRVTF